MRMSVVNWTNLQNHLPDDERDLWWHIERRTDGKMYSSEVSIAIPKAKEPMLLRIMHEHGMKLVTTRTEPCDHDDGAGKMPGWLCYMCDGKGKRKIISRSVPPLPGD